jgi:hypothetical protein
LCSDFVTGGGPPFAATSILGDISTCGYPSVAVFRRAAYGRTDGEGNGANAVGRGPNGLDSSLDQEYSKKGRDALIFFAARKVFVTFLANLSEGLLAQPLFV